MVKQLRVVSALIVFTCAALPADSDDLRNGYTPQHLAPRTITDICSDLSPTFAELRAAINTTGTEAAEAGGNAKGLGFWSPPKHFRSIEDDDIVVNKLLEPSLDEVTDIPIVVDQQPDNDAKRAAIELATAYETSLRGIKNYAHAAVVFERAAYGRQKEQVAAISTGGSQNSNRNDREMSADEARSILDDQSSDVGDASRHLKLPEFRWNKACGSRAQSP